MRLRNWWLGVFGFLAVVVACSGNSEDKGPHASAGKDNEAGAGSGGRAASGGSAGRAGRGGTAGASRGGASGFGGTGNSPSEGGESGTLANGGSIAGRGGSAGLGVSGTVGISGSAGTSNPSIPQGWHCLGPLYGDGNCDCGCGVIDSDCDDDDEIDECDTCNQIGSCTMAECPGRIDPDATVDCLPPPEDWTCLSSNYADGRSCDCGCGVVDPDCDDDEIDECATCGLAGACAGGLCPGPIDPDDISSCLVPESWTCSTRTYADGYYCDCGCGELDPDCASASRNDCEYCANPGGCSVDFCPGNIDQQNNAICSGPPLGWNCAPRFYGDGVNCHCGCGVVDPDCEESDCDVCNFEGSCSRRPCPGTIDPDNTANCLQPDPPSAWICESYLYADGTSCDCGCGAEDLDCLSTDIQACESCWACSQRECPAGVDPTDTTQCIPPPDDWTCDAQTFNDGASCECGCGAPDPDCEDVTAASCYTCPDGSCSDYTCGDIDPANNAHCVNEAPAGWTCDRDYYADQACDCGCGVVDFDCASAARSSCDYCNSPGSCSNAAQCLVSTINETNNAVCDG